MRSGTSRYRALVLLVGVTGAGPGALERLAHADGGTIQASGRSEGLEITVFTAPNPIRVGPVDISVLVLDTRTGEPIPGIAVNVRMVPRDGTGATLNLSATRDAATNKLFRSAIFDVPRSGAWDAEVTVRANRRTVRLPFRLEAAPRLADWSDLWLWVGWPLVAVVLYGLHRRLVWSRSGGRRSGRTNGPR